MQKEREYFDFANVEKQRNYVIPEEFAEGPYGAPRGEDTPVENKSTPWKEGQRTYSNFNYENKSLHEDRTRQFPGAHPTHDDPERHDQPPYSRNGSGGA